jgi:hypothetical protein
MDPFVNEERPLDERSHHRRIGRTAQDGTAFESVGNQRRRQPDDHGSKGQRSDPLTLRARLPDQMPQARRKHHHRDKKALIHQDSCECTFLMLSRCSAKASPS